MGKSIGGKGVKEKIGANFNKPLTIGRNPVIDELLGISIDPTYFDLKHYELNPSEIVKRVRDIGANTIRLGVFTPHGYTYYPSNIALSGPFLKGRNLLKEFEEECKKQSIRLAVYLNSKWVTYLYREHPNWIVKFKGRPYTFKDVDKNTSLIIYPMCPNSPFIEYFKKIVKEVVTISHLDAIYIDNFGIELFCECDYCKKKFGNKIPDRKNWSSPETQRYIKWMAKESRKIAKDIVSAARSKDSQMPVVFNRGAFWSATMIYSPEDNFQYAHKIGKCIHTESGIRFYNQPFEHINEQCAFGRSIDLSIWTWAEYPIFPFSYVPSSPEEVKIKTAKIIANGGRPILFSMPCAPLVNQKGMPGVKYVFELVARNKEFFNNVSFDKFAGIVCSSSSLRVYCQGNNDRLFEYTKIFSGAYELMIRNHIQYDFLLDKQIAFDNLKNYKVIILPDVVYLAPSQCEEIKKYVKNGGCVLATYETSLYNRDGTKRKDFALKDIFGAKYIKDLSKQFGGWSTSYSRFITNHPVNKNGLKENLFPIGGKYLAVRANDMIAKLLKRCRYFLDYPQEETEYPAIIARNYEKGKVVYIAADFFKLYHEKGLLEYAQFFKQSIEWFVDGKMQIITDLPDTVEITVTNNTKGAKIIHLVNCSFDRTRPIKEITPVAGKHLKIKINQNYKNAIDISTGNALKIGKDNGYIKISLPVLTGYNVIVLK